MTNIIIKKTKEKMKKDDTILIRTDNKLSDMNDMVSEEAIALRELILYGDFDKKFKTDVISLLAYYSSLLEQDDDRYDDMLKIFEEYMSDINWIEGSKFCRKCGMHKTDVIEMGISKLLLRYWQDYTIPTEKYDKIVYSHINEPVELCDIIKHHYKCLHNNSLDWDLKSKKYDYEIEVTYKDIKRIILLARDSGGHLDFYGDCHIHTTLNCIASYLSKKLNLPLFECWDLDDMSDEINQISDDIYKIVQNYMKDFECQLY